MKTQSPLRHGVLVLEGYGVRLAKERGHLVVEGGVANTRWRERFSRLDRDLKRVVVIGHSGTITLDAIDWLQGVGVPLLHLDHDGRIYFLSSPAARTVAQLRRAQARAGDRDLGVAISRDLVAAKIAGQRALLPQLPDGEEADPQLTAILDRAQHATTLPAVKDCEARAARAYWRAWKRVPIQLTRRAAQGRPMHWRSFGTRISPLTDPSPRRAVNPANAVLNYLYAILEAEAQIAALAARLDPTLGFLHTDRAERASLACDLMEPVRPLVDAFALSLYRERSIGMDDVFELRDGQCRLLPSLTRQLTATGALWARAVRPVADAIAKALVQHPKKGRAIVPGVPLPRTSSGRTPRGRTAVVRGFDGMPGTTWSSFCEPEHAWAGMHKFQRSLTANRQWERQHSPADRQDYKRHIQPRLTTIPLVTLQAATGLSKTTCHRIRRGTTIPHPRHWEALAEAGG